MREGRKIVECHVDVKRMRTEAVRRLRTCKAQVSCARGLSTTLAPEGLSHWIMTTDGIYEGTYTPGADPFQKTYYPRSESTIQTIVDKYKY